ncbi:hypothetical protein [Nocardioides sp. W7]|uniref:hypothetical protein n=1 Tax=Nocardioides sp. W7 TaxID=2931390 RepID=UPI001FD1828A|nr:hypothetical protein [Nocardioides sp. W7]
MGDHDRSLRFRLPRGDGLVVQRLLSRDGFAVEGPDGRPLDHRAELSVVVETEGREARVREVIARWAPGATLLNR